MATIFLHSSHGATTSWSNNGLETNQQNCVPKNHLVFTRAGEIVSCDLWNMLEDYQRLRWLLLDFCQPKKRASLAGDGSLIILPWMLNLDNWILSWETWQKFYYLGMVCLLLDLEVCFLYFGIYPKYYLVS